jgi:hypothetical protein
MAVVALTLGLAASACTAERRPKPDVRPTDLPGGLQLVGHEPLFARGMNAGLAVWNGYAYVGSRTDGSPDHEHPGLLVVDVSDPSAPRVVAAIGPPNEGNPGETSRELRIWHDQGLLLVLNFGCDPFLHACLADHVAPTVRFYDIDGSLAAAPRLVSTYRPSRLPHELFLWQDPLDPTRALLYLSTPGTEKELLVTDISRAREGRFREVASWGTTFPDPGADDTLHSMSVSPDGRTAYLAHLTAGFIVLDTTSIAEGEEHPQIRMLTATRSRPRWQGPGPHSAVPVPNRNLALTTDEVYGGSEGGGCPWGWVRLIDVTETSAPSVVSEYRVDPYNREGYCEEVDAVRDSASSFSSHNPTVTQDLALVSWHSAGLQVISIDDARHPREVAEFIPEPLSSVATEDPALSSGRDKVVFWSYPVIVDGLIYVVDIRNGLYILSYDGPHESEVDGAAFLEGNSNLVEASAA